MTKPKYLKTLSESGMKNQLDKKAVIVDTDAVINPRAMMVHP